MRFLSRFQLVCIMSVSFLPLLFWVYPRYATMYAGIDGQWAVLGVCLIAVYSGIIHGLLNTRYPDTTAIAMAEQAFGKLIGKTVGFLFLPGYVLFVAVSLFSFAVTLSALLPNTPRIVTIGALALVSAVGAFYGIETIARLSAVVFPVTLIILASVCLYIIPRGTWSGVTFGMADWTKTSYAAMHLLPVFFGLNLYLVFNYFYDHNRVKSVRIMMIAVGIACLTLISVYITATMVVSFSGLTMLSRPVEFVMQLAETRGFILQRFGVVFIVLVTLFETVFLASHLWGLSHVVTTLFNWPWTQEKWVVVPSAVVIMAVFYLIHNQEVQDFLIMHVLTGLSWVYLIGEPTLKLLVSYIRGQPRSQMNRQALQ